MPTRIPKIKHAPTVASVLAPMPQGRATGLAPDNRRHSHAFLLPLVSFALNGCAQRGAPSFALFGVYFPAWMLCAFLGILAAIGARVLFVATGLAAALPFQLFVCMATGGCFALLVWFLWFA
jgi:hypothetical protein